MLHKRLKELGVPHHICPSPRHLTESCGIALKFHEGELGVLVRSAREINVAIKVINGEGRALEHEG